jgi:Xaa-Pro aminopeptidase
MARENDLDLDYFCQRMTADGLAAVVSASPNGVFCTSGALIITHNPARDRLAFSITTAKGRQALAVCKAEESLCHDDSWIKDIRSYVEFQELPTALLARTLDDLGLSKGRVGIDLDYLRAKFFRELETVAPGIEFVASDTMLAEVYQRKTPHLIERMRRAAVAVDAVIQAALKEPVVGRSERDIRSDLRAALANGGADATYIVVASGPNTAIPEHRAETRVVSAGDVLTFDVAASYDGYVTESATSIIAGVPQHPALAALNAVQAATARALKPRATGNDVYEAAADAARAAGQALASDVIGYGLTFGGRQYPILARGSEHMLSEGHTVVLDLVLGRPTEMAVQAKRVWLLESDRAICLSGAQAGG